MKKSADPPFVLLPFFCIMNIRQEERTGHIIIIVYLVSFASGISIHIFALMEYFRRRNALFLFFFFWYGCITLNVVLNAYAYYILINQITPVVNSNIVEAIVLVNNLLLLFLSPYIILSALPGKRSPFFSPLKLSVMNVLPYCIVLPAVWIIASLGLPPFSGDPVPPAISISYRHILAVLLALFLYLIVHRNRIDNRYIRKTILIFFIFFLLFLPGLIAQTIVPTTYVYLIRHYIDFFSMASVPILYLIWNIITLIVYGYFYLRISPEDLQPPAARIHDLRLSCREEEVTGLLLQGMTYREISEKLFISVETVKSHINSIYRKTGTGNKIELYNLLIREQHRIPGNRREAKRKQDG